MSLYIYPNPYKVHHQVNPNVNYGLWVIMMCHCRFTHCTKCTLLVGMLIMGKAIHVWGQGVHGELLYLLFGVAVNLKLF